MSGFIPQIGAVGVFTLLAPYDALLTPQVAYTCRSLRMLSDIAASGDLIWERYYEPHGVSAEAYQEDLANNVCIVGLQAGTGEWVYVPSSFIASAPDINGVLYTPVVLGVSLGPLPDSFQLDGLIGRIEGLVQSAVGVKPTIKGVIISQPAIISHEESARLEAIRLEAVIDNESDYSKLQRALDDLQATRSKLQQLEAWVKNNLPAP
jgi:hypothetical protein